MCTVCGCSSDGFEVNGDAKIRSIQHHPDLHGHDHGQGHDHDHHRDGQRAPGQRRLITIEMDLLAKNNAVAQRNRAQLQNAGIFAINLMSSPGAGKTTLLTRTLTALSREMPLAVIEGDQETALDADRIRATGTPAIQINTGKGCHLDAQMIEQALAQLNLHRQSLLFIENVGNLVCPAGFDLGESARVVVLSTTEGEDKPLKYQDMFATADLVLINKIDLLPYLRFDMQLVTNGIRRIRPSVPVIGVSAHTGDGLDEWYAWLRAGIASVRHRHEEHLAAE